MLDSYTRPVRLSLRAHPQLNERWVQNLIANDPSIIGLGDLELRAQERIQPRAGRLDLLLQDRETNRRYETEIQLGPTDESHIIRVIEYWDTERKRYPQYDHCAVLIAEDITSRFLNVISLFNGAVPLVAIQMQAMQVGQHLTLVFTKVVDELSRGLVDEDEEAEAAPTDRSYWEKKGSLDSVELADKLLEVVRRFDPFLNLKYNKFYIGLAKDGLPFNFVRFKPKKMHINIEINLPETDDVTERIDSAGLDALEYNRRFSYYKIRITSKDLAEKSEIVRDLMHLAYERRAALP